jgi:hypothetical protein
MSGYLKLSTKLVAQKWFFDQLGSQGMAATRRFPSNKRSRNESKAGWRVADQTHADFSAGAEDGQLG